MKYIRYNTEKLIRAADCREVARQIGIPVKGKFCQCVSGMHSETQFNHCAIYPDHIHCFSCGDNRNVISMVKGYYENVLHQYINFGEACRIVGDCLGGAEYFTEDEVAPEKRVPLLSSKELETIGLRSSAGDISVSALYNCSRAAYLSLVYSASSDALARVIRLAKTVPEDSPLFHVLEDRVKRIREILKKIGKI